MCRKLSVLCRCVSTAPAQSRTHRPSTFVSAWGILQQHALGFHGLVTEWGPTPGTLSHMRRKRCRERLHIGIDLLDLGGGLLLFFFSSFFFPCNAPPPVLSLWVQASGALTRRIVFNTDHSYLAYPACGVWEWERKCAEAPWKVWGGAGGRSQLNESHAQYETPHRTSSISHQCCRSTKWVCTIPPETYSHSSAASVNN